MSYYQSLNVNALADMDQCQAAIKKIELKGESYGSPAAFRKGASCELKKGASNKIAAINKKYDRLYAEYENASD